MSSSASERMKPEMACLEAMYRGVVKLGVWPAMLLMWTTRLGFVGLTLPARELAGGFSQREMASWVVRMGWVMLMSRVA